MPFTAIDNFASRLAQQNGWDVLSFVGFIRNCLSLGCRAFGAAAISLNGPVLTSETWCFSGAVERDEVRIVIERERLIRRMNDDFGLPLDAIPRCIEATEFQWKEDGLYADRQYVGIVPVEQDAKDVCVQILRARASGCQFGAVPSLAWEALNEESVERAKAAEREACPVLVTFIAPTGETASVFFAALDARLMGAVRLNDHPDVIASVDRARCAIGDLLIDAVKPEAVAAEVARQNEGPTGHVASTMLGNALALVDEDRFECVASQCDAIDAAATVLKELAWLGRQAMPTAPRAASRVETGMRFDVQDASEV